MRTARRRAIRRMGRGRSGERKQERVRDSLLCICEENKFAFCGNRDSCCTLNLWECRQRSRCEFALSRDGRRCYDPALRELSSIHLILAKQKREHRRRKVSHSLPGEEKRPVGAFCVGWNVDYPLVNPKIQPSL